MRKKLKALLTAALIAFGATSAQAAIEDDLKNVYNDVLINTSNPKVVEGQERGYITLGSVYYRAPRNTITPITIIPPRIRAGCSGVDFTAGALSYLNADQLVSWLQSTLQAAPAIAFEVALQKYLPGVKSVLNEVSQLAQIVNTMNLDSCQAARKLVYTITGDPAEQRSEMEHSVAANQAPKEGLASDFFASITGMAKDFKEKLDEFFSSGTQSSNNLKEEIKQVRGDYLYESFRKKYGDKFDEKNAVQRLQFQLLASLIGDVQFKRIGDADSDPSLSKLYRVDYFKPLINSVEDVLHVKNYGVGKIYGIDTVYDSLGKFKGIDEGFTRDLYEAMRGLCKASVPLKAQYQNMCDKDAGLATIVEANMLNIYNKIITHQPLTAQEKQFVGATPLPILKWLNTLAYYPGVAETFISNSKDWIATFYLEAMIGDALKNAVIIPWRELPESQRKDLAMLWKVSRERMQELYQLRNKSSQYIQTFNDFANFVNHFEKALVMKLASQNIYTNL
jgi:conjugative transfer pilus assembly protein TraH